MVRGGHKCRTIVSSADVGHVYRDRALASCRVFLFRVPLDSREKHRRRCPKDAPLMLSFCHQTWDSPETHVNQKQLYRCLSPALQCRQHAQGTANQAARRLSPGDLFNFVGTLAPPAHSTSGRVLLLRVQRRCLRAFAGLASFRRKPDLM